MMLLSQSPFFSKGQKHVGETCSSQNPTTKPKNTVDGTKILHHLGCINPYKIHGIIIIPGGCLGIPSISYEKLPCFRMVRSFARLGSWRSGNLSLGSPSETSPMAKHAVPLLQSVFVRG